MSVDKLIKLMPPPASPVNAPTPSAWLRAETAIGTGFPSDYKAFLATYGEGRVSDFLDIFIPESPHQWLDLATALAQDREVFAERRYPLRFGLFPAVPGLLPIGQTDNGDMLYYLVDGDPETWKIAFYESRGEDVEVFDAGLTEFLCRALDGTIDAFASGGPGPVFTPSAAAAGGP